MTAAFRSAVIVGANLAGGRAAEALRAEGFDGRIVLIGAEPDRPYERPPLSKDILRGESPPEKAFLRNEAWYADNGVELMLGTRADRLDIDNKRVATKNGEVPYDKLLLCTGGRPRMLDVPGADLAGIHTLRTMEDSRAIGDALRAGARLLIVGFGFIGAEIAASARTLGAEVTIIEASQVPLVRALGPEVGAVMARLHADNGVRTLPGTSVERFEGSGRVERAALSDGTTLACDLVVIGIGIQPNIELAADAGIEVENGIVVDERCHTSVEDVFAAGDVARHPNAIVGDSVRIEHWQNAQNQGAAAGRAMLGSDEPFVEAPWFWSDQYDVTIQMAGLPLRYDRLVYRGDPATRKFSAFYMDGPSMVAAFAMNRGKDVRGAKAVLEARKPVTEEQLADEGLDLRALAKS